MNGDLTGLIIKVIVAVVMALISRYVIPALKAYVEKHKESQIFDVIETAVRAAEQTITGSGEGAEKKKQVENFVSAWLLKKGIDVDREQLDALIEECVYLLQSKNE